MIKRGKKLTEYKTGHMIFRQGAEAVAVHYLAAGLVKEMILSDGREAIVDIVESGCFFGVGALDDRLLRNCSAVALRPSTVFSISNDAMVEAMQALPGLATLFMAHLMERTIRAESDKAGLIFNSTEKRLAQRLLVLAHSSDGTASARAIGPEITQEALANMIGTTRPRVNYFMNKFRKLGLIRYNGVIEVNAPLLYTTVLEEKRR